MHAARSFFAIALLSAAVLTARVPTAEAVPVSALYVVIVPGTDPLQAAQEAMRVELVRLIGTRDAASDPALAGLVDGARQYVQLERAMTSGKMQVLFDEPALSAAIGAAGRSLWGVDRPLLWVQLPPQDPVTAEALRARLIAAAEARGLPITIVGVAGAPGTPAVATAGGPTAGGPGPTSNSVAAGNAGAAAAIGPALTSAPQGLLATARSAGASAALTAQQLSADPNALQWTLTAADSSGQWVGGPELAIDNATDTLANAAHTRDQAPVAQFDCHVVGVTNLASLVNVIAAVQSAPGVSQVAISDVEGDELTLHLEARGSITQVARALSSDQLRATSPGTTGSLEYRYVAAP